MQALGTDEVAPGITFSELSSRRDALGSLLPTGAVCVLPSAPQQFRVGAIPHPYRQNSDFLYLTGLQQEGVAVFHKVSESSALLHRLLVNHEPACLHTVENTPLNSTAMFVYTRELLSAFSFAETVLTHSTERFCRFSVQDNHLMPSVASPKFAIDIFTHKWEAGYLLLPRIISRLAATVALRNL
jgi:Aminopeptidase P, N-terminal domain